MTHKPHQHDAPEHEDGEREYGDPDEAWASAMTPEEYVLSSPEAMESAVEQQRIIEEEA